MDSSQQISDSNPQGRKIRWTIFLLYSFAAYVALMLLASSLSFSSIIEFFIGNTVVWAILFSQWMRGGVAGSGLIHFRNPDIKNGGLGFLESFIFFPIGMFGFPIVDFYAAYHVGNNPGSFIWFAIGGLILFGGLLLMIRSIISKGIEQAS